MSLLPLRFPLLSSFCCLSLLAHAQTTPSRWDDSRARFYVGLEGAIFANRDTQLATTASLSAGDKYVEPRPALLAGYALTPRLAVEVGFQPLPVATGFAYGRDTPQGYIGFSSLYNNDYLYLPLRGVAQVLGTGHRLGLSVLAGGGPAFTSLEGGLPITPNGTTAHTVTTASGTTLNSTDTQQILRDKSAFAVLEAGLRGSWQVLPRLHLDLTLRHLWGLGGSVRDISLDISTPGQHASATLTTPVRGLATGLGVRYMF